METIRLKINKIKNIDNADIELPLENGLYSLVGTNGCGKSTILLILAQLISRHYLGTLHNFDFSKDSSVEFEIDGHKDLWYNPTGSKSKWVSKSFPNTLRLNGMYEGSLFYGTRFSDSRVIDALLQSGKLRIDDIVPADNYVISKLSYIIHGDSNHYSKLRRVKNKYITERLKINNTPYFNEIDGKLISQYRMSSGECMLISLLHFIYNSLERRSLPADQKILVLIDEIELALHPVAVDRLLSLLVELTKEHKNLTVLLTSHSPEVIRKIRPSNQYRIINENGHLSVESNCFPSYLIRDVYIHDGFDYLFLVEDELAKCFVEKVLFDNNLRSRKLIHVVPVGGWKNVIDLHNNLLRGNVLGVGTRIVSILDGDIQNELEKTNEYDNLIKMYLPIKSIEKYIYENIIINKNERLYNVLSDKYFTVKSLNSLIAEHYAKYPERPNQPDKKFFFRLKKDLESRNINEDYFVTNFCNDIFNLIDIRPFVKSIEGLLK